jgi:DNA replication and repair protein RecF
MIAELRLKHYRSYGDDSFEPAKGVNIIVGPNASGKTNLLEAILMVARGKSYRAKEADLIQHDADWARIDARLYAGDERTIKLENTAAIKKSYVFDGKAYQRLTHAHTLPVVLFEPNHLLLLSGGPEGRRAYLDDMLEQAQATYGALRKTYRRILAQRNALLKQAPASHDMFPWDVRLSQVAGKIVQARTELVDEFSLVFPALYRALSQTKTKVTLRYASQWPPDQYESNLLKALTNTIETDRLRGYTTNGPHRDDLEVLFEDYLAQETASRGESRTAVLGLKVLELELIEKSRNIRPILLLDDVFSELDGSRRRALTEHLQKYQTFITTTDADVVLQHFTDDCQIIPLARS